MSVVKGKRSQSKFEAEHQLFKLRDEVTNLILLQFGFSWEKYEKQIEKYRESHKNMPNVEDIVKKLRARCEGFHVWFIRAEQDAVLQILRDIQTEFTMANSIFPTEITQEVFRKEFAERRMHLDNAIAKCFCLKQEIQYVIRVLPVDMNKYNRFAEMIDKEITLLKGVRQSDNRFLKQKRKESNFSKLMSKKQIKNMKSLYYMLFGKEPRWKKAISKSHSQPGKKSKGRSTGTTTSQTMQSPRQTLQTSTSSAQPLTEIPWE